MVARGDVCPLDGRDVDEEGVWHGDGCAISADEGERLGGLQNDLGKVFAVERAVVLLVISIGSSGGKMFEELWLDMSLRWSNLGEVDEGREGDSGVLGGIFAPVLALNGLVSLVASYRLRLFAVRARPLLVV